MPIIRLRPALLAALSFAPGLAAAADEGDGWFARHRAELVGLYKHLHAHPELSYREVETAARVAQELKQAGAEVTTGVGKLGVVGLSLLY